MDWIKVSERKPEAKNGMGVGHPAIISDDVLCYFPEGAWSNYVVCNYDHESNFWTVVERLESADQTPTHWMPLPKAPL